MQNGNEQKLIFFDLIWSLCGPLRVPPNRGKFMSGWNLWSSAEGARTVEFELVLKNHRYYCCPKALEKTTCDPKPVFSRLFFFYLLSLLCPLNIPFSFAIFLMNFLYCFVGCTLSFPRFIFPQCILNFLNYCVRNSTSIFIRAFWCLFKVLHFLKTCFEKWIYMLIITAVRGDVIRDVCCISKRDQWTKMAAIFLLINCVRHAVLYRTSLNIEVHHSFIWWSLIIARTEHETVNFAFRQMEAIH